MQPSGCLFHLSVHCEVTFDHHVFSAANLAVPHHQISILRWPSCINAGSAGLDLRGMFNTAQCLGVKV